MNYMHTLKDMATKNEMKTDDRKKLAHAWPGCFKQLRDDDVDIPKSQVLPAKLLSFDTR